MTKERLLAFTKAWSHGDVGKVLHFFTEDCVYRPSVTNGLTERFIGKKEVEKAIKNMIQFDNSRSSKVSNIQIFGDFGFWEWEYITNKNECIVGCDVFKFRNEDIVEKNAYRKVKTKTD
ncbi:nuclear transport factor 2 family protein [Croceitalea marina]|uniref:Nuclear transport factor 2 family protein n=1 Tax=Croceitalea marina TaxID=1775166 RepID=A0ABW5MYN2_9FLAO